MNQNPRSCAEKVIFWTLSPLTYGLFVGLSPLVGVWFLWQVWKGFLEKKVPLPGPQLQVMK